MFESQRLKTLGEWSWIGERMFRQSLDGIVTQDVIFLYCRGARVTNSPKTERAYKMLQALAENAVAGSVGDDVVAEVFLNASQIRILAEEGGSGW